MSQESGSVQHAQVESPDRGQQRPCFAIPLGLPLNLVVCPSALEKRTWTPRATKLICTDRRAQDELSDIGKHIRSVGHESVGSGCSYSKRPDVRKRVADWHADVDFQLHQRTREAFEGDAVQIGGEFAEFEKREATQRQAAEFAKSIEVRILQSLGQEQRQVFEMSEGGYDLHEQRERNLVGKP